MTRWLSAFVLVGVLAGARAEALETVKVAEGVYAFVGEKAQRSADNLANNATFGLIVTPDGAVLIDAGGSRTGAEALHEAVRAVTSAPVRYVVNTGGQDHRWLGNGYWRGQGAKIIASKAAVDDQKERNGLQLTMLSRLLGDKLAGTEPAYADIVFEEAHKLEIGGLALEIRHVDAAHTPGDAFVWIPSKSVIFAGDIVFTERMLGVLPVSSSKGWIAAFDAIAALKPRFVIPGHGAPTDLARAKADTRDYLAHLRGVIGTHLEAGGDMLGAAKLDQSAFKRLELFDSLAGRNAEAVFAEMEFE